MEILHENLSNNLYNEPEGGNESKSIKLANNTKISRVKIISKNIIGKEMVAKL